MFQPVLVFLERFGNVVGRFLLTIVYAVAVAPVGLCFRLFSDSLMYKSAPQSTYVPWNQLNETLEDARRQD